MKNAPLAIEAYHFSDTVAEVMPVRLRQKVELVRADIHAAGGNLVQQRFPDVRSATINERHSSGATLAQRVTETCRELDAAGSAAHDDDLVCIPLAVHQR